GEDALVRLKGSKYDAVILDMRMPDLSGEQLYERLRSSDPSHAERVIFTTGDLVNEQMRRFLDGTGRPCVPSRSSSLLSTRLCPRHDAARSAWGRSMLRPYTPQHTTVQPCAPALPCWPSCLSCPRSPPRNPSTFTPADPTDRPCPAPRRSPATPPANSTPCMQSCNTISTLWSPARATACGSRRGAARPSTAR